MKKNLRAFLLSLIFIFTLIFSPNVSAGSAVGGPCHDDIDCISNNCVNSRCLSPGETEEKTSGETSAVEINFADYLTLSNGAKVSDTFSRPSDMINLIVRLVFLIAGVILFIMVILAGINMIAGANKQDIEKSKKTITGAAIGFIVMFAAYWIMQLIAMLTGADIGF